MSLPANMVLGTLGLIGAAIRDGFGVASVRC